MLLQALVAPAEARPCTTPSSLDLHLAWSSTVPGDRFHVQVARLLDTDGDVDLDDDALIVSTSIHDDVRITNVRNGTETTWLSGIDQDADIRVGDLDGQPGAEVLATWPEFPTCASPHWAGMDVSTAEP